MFLSISSFHFLLPILSHILPVSSFFIFLPHLHIISIIFPTLLYLLRDIEISHIYTGRFQLYIEKILKSLLHQILFTLNSLTWRGFSVETSWETLKLSFLCHMKYLTFTIRANTYISRARSTPIQIHVNQIIFFFLIEKKKKILPE